MDYKLRYPQRKKFSLISYTKVDGVENVDDRKITSGGALFLGECLVAWLRKKHTSISLSTTEVEYILATSS